MILIALIFTGLGFIVFGILLSSPNVLWRSLFGRKFYCKKCGKRISQSQKFVDGFTRCNQVDSRQD